MVVLLLLLQYLYFYELQTPEVTLQYLQGLVALIKEHLENMEHGAARNEGEIRYRDILRYIESKSIPAAASSAPVIA